MAFALAALSGTTARAQQDAGLAALNAVRQAAGLTPLVLNQRLSRAAAGHARYLLLNRVRGHQQRRGRAGFTGTLPTERARHAGYVTAGVSENIAQGSASAPGAVDDLMSAIYHRFGFLAVDIDEVGIGWGPGKPEETPWVFNLSDSGLNAWCEQPPAEARFQPPGKYAQLCGAGGAKLMPAAVEAQQARLPLLNPAWVLWPPDGYTRTPPAFFEETPDPLPDRKFSGYPVSVQFNRFKVKAVTLRGFRLVAVDAGGTEREIKPLRLITQRNDPNHEFSGLDFAWFPLQRLAWNTAYRASADFEVDGRPQHIAWGFRTQDPGLPLVTVNPRDTQLSVRSSVPVAVYVPPTERVPHLTGFQWEGPAGMKAEAEAIDPNTLRVQVTGPPCAAGLLTLSDGHRLKLQLAGADGGGCETAPPDFAIAGANERLVLEAGKPYRVQVKGKAGLRKIGWKFPSTMQVKVDLEPPDVARVVIQGRPCDVAEFSLPGGRAFRAAVAGPGCPATPKGASR